MDDNTDLKNFVNMLCRAHIAHGIEHNFHDSGIVKTTVKVKFPLEIQVYDWKFDYYGQLIQASRRGA